MGPLAEQILDWGIIAIISIGGTYVALVRRMHKKYQTLIGQKIYEETQKIIHQIVDEKLSKIERQLMFMSLMCHKAWKKAGIEEEEIESVRRSCSGGI